MNHLPEKVEKPRGLCHIEPLEQKNGWLEEFSMLFFEVPGTFHRTMSSFIGSFSPRNSFPFAERIPHSPRGGWIPGCFFWDILGSHKGKAADREVTINNCPKCLLQQFLLSVLLKMS